MRRGFTAMELAVVLSISALVVPSVFQLHRLLERATAIGHFQVENAQLQNELRELLRTDARCGAGYELKDGELWRQGCGRARVLARRVHSFNYDSTGLSVTRALTFSPDDARVETLFVPREAR